ncbi:MAG TPA: hypothetical protein VNC80_16920, partial [Mycobacteriales bacterium]|nr:hypothetical protein [Mycobacteriales bacterium]
MPVRSQDAHRRATAADAEARSALRWARAAGAPVADRLGAALGSRLADTGRTADAMEVLGPLLDAPTGDREVDVLAAMAHSYVLMIRGNA